MRRAVPVFRQVGRTPISFRATAGCSVYFSAGVGLVRCQAGETWGESDYVFTTRTGRTCDTRFRTRP
ncbi:hypothetical protein SCWH03_45530 [Streptomyces pacificus]|uniref:Uncharacterized protein n=1 Tax=Streptomyces pacificus TaxID=2705029 RepID=A0A6A0B126_9ACTN|nr:hypothetical protein SCWH03_45530 [Streptomyces pacificus]